MLKKANLFIENYRKKHGKLPPQQQYNRKVASWLKALPK
jgi:hypothetical protein